MKRKIRNCVKLRDALMIQWDDEVFFYRDRALEEIRERFRSIFASEVKTKDLIGKTFIVEIKRNLIFPTALIENKVILMDDREPVEMRKLLRDVAEVKRLPFGDYRFEGLNGAVVIERKTAEDLINDIVSGELSEQIERLSNFEGYRILLIEGFITSTSEGFVRTSRGVRKVHFNAVRNALMSAQLIGQVLIDHSPNLFFTSLRIRSLYEYFQKEEHRFLRSYREPQKSFPPQVKILSMFPGYGPELSLRALREFKNLKSFLLASPEERAKVRGIGRSKAEIIDEILEEEVSFDKI